MYAAIWTEKTFLVSPLPVEADVSAGISTIVGDASSGFAGGFGEDFVGTVVFFGAGAVVFALSATAAFGCSAGVTGGLATVSLGAVTTGLETGGDAGAVVVGVVFAGSVVSATAGVVPGGVRTTPAQR